jgi:hypothetical protein
MENVFEPMNFDGEVFEPMNFDGEVFEPMNFDGSSDVVYFDGEEYSNFLPFTILKRNATPYKPSLGSVIKSIVRKEPSVKISATVVPPVKQSIITDVNKKPFVVTPLNNKMQPIGRPFFPIKNRDVVISEPISKNDIKPMDIKAISIEVSKTTGSIVPKPSVLTPSQISVVTETIVKDNNNKPFLITPISGLKPNGFTEDSIKPNVVISIDKKDLPKPINAKNEEGKTIEVATAIKEDIVKPKEEVVPTISAESTPNAPVKSNKKLYIGIGVVAVGLIAFFLLKKKK